MDSESFFLSIGGDEPIAESLSKLPADTICINLKIVERCKNDITMIANCLRDKIYGITPQFNLLKYTAPDLILYNKKFSSWIESYINDIKENLELINECFLSFSLYPRHSLSTDRICVCPQPLNRQISLPTKMSATEILLFWSEKP